MNDLVSSELLRSWNRNRRVPEKIREMGESRENKLAIRSKKSNDALKSWLELGIGEFNAWNPVTHRMTPFM